MAPTRRLSPHFSCFHTSCLHTFHRFLAARMSELFALASSAPSRLHILMISNSLHQDQRVPAQRNKPACLPAVVIVRSRRNTRNETKKRCANLQSSQNEGGGPQTGPVLRLLERTHLLRRGMMQTSGRLITFPPSKTFSREADCSTGRHDVI